MARTGLVLVSHSGLLAEGVRELAEQVARGAVPMAAVGGAEDGSLGTNALAILSAVEAVADGDGVAGVLILMDLGSAVLSAEAALDQLAQETRRRVRMVDAPFVEGAVAAAVEASLGSDPGTVAAAAEAARGQPKLG
ncbi:MAG: PTS-dependent dihydroxyacetone kinase phosphotransferase subunit DhaM [Candidatus Dormibacteraeota bacterium]|nr:PTS-dependent dihydroxyacetone kinase phosphotransferase subunit DhaM [Candidatus Dormibacteraeota bacterium]